MTMPSRVISTWFYENSVEEGGQYAQVRGSSSSEQFRDIYRRCVGVFFASARRANPAARLLLYSNAPWGARSSDADEVGRLLAALHVEQVVVSYSHVPPDSWPKAWRNQFFVFDVLRDLVQRYEPADLAVVLDSDVVWSGHNSTELMWRHMAVDGLLTYDVGYAPDHVVNGLSRRMLTRMGEATGVLCLRQDNPIPYMGGEFVGGGLAVSANCSVSVMNYWRNSCNAVPMTPRWCLKRRTCSASPTPSWALPPGMATSSFAVSGPNP